MASPFTRYQGEQIQPINILPYTAQIADNIGKGIASIGEGIGAYQNYQRKASEDKAKATTLAQSVLNQYLETDGPEDDASGVVPMKVKDTAPSHIKDLFKKSEGQPDGIAGLATTDLTAFLTLQQKYEQDEQLKFDNKLKKAGVDYQKAQLGLAEREFGLRASAQEQDYKFKLRDFEWRVARGEKSDKLEQDRLDLARQQFELEKILGPEKIKLLQAQVRKEAAGATIAEKTVLTEEAKQALIDARQKVAPSVEVEQFGEKTVRSGVIQLPNGLFELTDDIDQYLKDNNLKVEDLTAQQPVQVPYSTSIARALSGDKAFDPTLPAVKNSSTNKKQFVQKVYEQLITNFPENKAAIDHQFRWNEAAKGENKEIELDQQRYDLAVKYINTKQFQEKVGGALGVKQEVDIPAEKAPTGVQVISETKNSFGVITRQTLYKTDQRMVDEAYDSAYKQFADRNQPFPMTRDDAYQVFGLFGGMKRWTDADGNVFYTNAKGETTTEAELQGKGLTRAPTTEAGQKRQGANNWLRQYVGKGKDVGAYVLRAQTKNVQDPMSESPIINPEQAQKDVIEIERDIAKADKYIDKMVQMWKDKTWYQNYPLIGARWETEYTTYQRGLETFRKNFIAPGTETEKDAERLGDMMAQPTFWRNLQDVDKTIETLELTRSLIADSATAKASAYGIDVIPKSGLRNGMSPEQVSRRITEIVEKMKDKYPDIYQKYSDKK